MKIYVASSWRNLLQPAVVSIFRSYGHEVYDFRHPEPGNDGFAWRALDPDWQKWTPERFRERLDHPVARHGFGLDMDALKACDACFLVLPCGRSAHLELGYAVGAGKKTAVLMDPKGFEPELMYRMVDHLLVDVHELQNLAEKTWGGRLIEAYR